jgi:hypothetical protein
MVDNRREQMKKIISITEDDCNKILEQFGLLVVTLARQLDAVGQVPEHRNLLDVRRNMDGSLNIIEISRNEKGIFGLAGFANNVDINFPDGLHFIDDSVSVVNFTSTTTERKRDNYGNSI